MKPFNKLTLRAGVAELADAQDLGSCGRKALGVQVPPPAPSFLRYSLHTAKTFTFDSDTAQRQLVSISFGMQFIAYLA
jgi:hypothetical protein